MRPIIWLYINILRRFISLIINETYRLFEYHKNKIKVDGEMRRLQNEIKTLDDVIKESKSFEWIPDFLNGFIDWSPSIITFLIRSKKDDCDGAAEYTKWLCKLAGIEAKIICMMSKKPFIVDSHVLIAARVNGRTLLFSNGQLMDGNFDSINDALKWYNDNQETKFYWNDWVEIKY